MRSVSPRPCSARSVSTVCFRAAAVDLERIQSVPTLCPPSGGAPFTPRLRRWEPVFLAGALCGGKAGRDEQHPVEPQRIMRQLCGVQMAEMRRLNVPPSSLSSFYRTILRLSRRSTDGGWHELRADALYGIHAVASQSLPIPCAA